MATDGQRFCLKWNDFRNSVTALFEDLRKDEELVDITLCCEGKKVKAHRMMLSACSPYFRELLKENPCQHPVFFLKDTTFSDLAAVVEFVYNGEVNVTQGQLSSFLKTAEMLQVRGLTGDDDKDSSPAPAAAAPAPRTPHPPVAAPPPLPPPRPFQRRPPMTSFPAMRLPSGPPKRVLPPTAGSPSQPSPQKRPMPMSMPVPHPPPPPPPANSFTGPPEVVALADSPSPPAVSPAAKRRRHSGSSSGDGGPATPAAAEPPSEAASPAASPAGGSSDAPLPSPAGLPPPPPSHDPAGATGSESVGSSVSAAPPPPLPLPPPPLPLPPPPPPPPHADPAGQQGGMVKVEKIDIADDEEGLAALGQVVDYEGGYDDSNQSFAGMAMGDNSQGMFVAGTSDAGGPGSELLLDGAGGTLRTSYPCQLCPKTYSTADNLRAHMDLHKGRTLCQLCGKRFSTFSARNFHIRTIHRAK